MTLQSDAGEAQRAQVRTLIDTIEAIQRPIEDFRCEFEGTVHLRGRQAIARKLGGDGLFNSFSGIFIWKRGGDTYSDSMQRIMPESTVTRESLVVRARERQAEDFRRLNDEPLGIANIKSPKEINADRFACYGHLYLLDAIKRDFSDKICEMSVHDEELEERPVKVLDVGLKGLPPGTAVFRYWIDLRRSGHVVRTESYGQGKVLRHRQDIQLASYKIGDAEVWMPSRGEYTSFNDIKGDEAVIEKEPTTLETLYVVDGTMEFNKRPGREVFTIKYKPGTPVSDHLRQLTYEFGQQKIGPRPTKADNKRMLDEQIARAEEQKSELVAAAPSRGFDWSSWAVRGIGAAVLLSLAVLWVQRRTRR